MANGLSFATAWSARRDRIDSAFRFKMYDDVGPLQIDGNVLRFNGRKQPLAIRTVTGVDVLPQRPNWIAVLLAVAAVAPLAVLANYLEPGRSLVQDLLVLLAAAAIGLYVNSRVKWVHVSYRGEDGTPGEAYFTDGSTFGWGGIRGGTQKLFEAVRAIKRGPQPTK